MSPVHGSAAQRVHLAAPAKLNLHLEVLRQRHDGYHEIETILQAIDLSDRLRLTLRERWQGRPPRIELLVRPDGAVPDDDRNLCWQAARRFCHEKKVSGHLQVELDKAIPTGAGLGGGSSDAMAVLLGCDRLFGTACEPAELARLGAGIGADVPFFLRGGTQLARGTGTDLTPLPPLRKVAFVVLRPRFAIDTGSVYGALKMGLTVRSPVANLQVIKPLLARFPSRPWFGYNRLEDVVMPAHPDLSRLLLQLREECPVAMLSGSGSAIFGVPVDARRAEGLVRQFSSSMAFARAVGPCDHGVRILEG